MKLGPNIILSALLSLTLVGCAGLATPQPERAPLRFAYSAESGDLSVILAREKGYFAKAGVEVTPLLYENYSQALGDFLGGKYDGMTATLGDAISLAQPDPSLRVILAQDISVGADGVVASDRIRQIADLGGKRIGVNIGTTGELFVVKMLEAGGLNLSDVTLVGMDPSEAPARLSSGDVDAAYTWDPYMTQAIQGGGHLVFSSTEVEGLFPDVVIFRGHVLESRSEEVRAFVLGWFQAVNDRLADPAGTNQLLATALNLAPEETAAEGVRLLTLNDNESLFTHGDSVESLYYTGQLYVDFFVTGGLMTRPTDINNLLDPSFLQ